MENNEQLNIIDPVSLRRRIKRELELLEEEGYLTKILCVTQEDDDKLYNIITYKISIYNKIDEKTYEFTVPIDYPFRPPKLAINNRFYSDYQKIGSPSFTDALQKYKGIKCFCCDSILCSNNWRPNLGFKHIFTEVNTFKNYCREIAHRVIIDIIKRKYLVEDVNIAHWLY